MTGRITTVANLVTLSRLVLLLAVILLTHHATPVWHLVNVLLLIVAFVTDAVDGAIARSLNETSRFGALFDVATDRIVEIVLWILFVQIGLVSIWVVVVFVVRGTITDSIRAAQIAETGRTPFEALSSPLARWLVAGKFMRVFYAVVKAVTFCWLMLYYALVGLQPNLAVGLFGAMAMIGQVLVLVAVSLCVLRGLPVVVEFLQSDGSAEGRE